MARTPQYTLEDFGHRVLTFLYEQDEPMRTDRIAVAVRGTDMRVVDGLIYLKTKGKVRMIKDNYFIFWEVNREQPSE